MGVALRYQAAAAATAAAAVGLVVTLSTGNASHPRHELSAASRPSLPNPSGQAGNTAFSLIAEARDPVDHRLWGVRRFTAPDGETCLQLGRLQGGSLGFIGAFGAFSNDHSFHPFGSGGNQGARCANTKTSSQGYDFLVSEELYASGEPPTAGGCPVTGSTPACPDTGRRIAFYGLVGSEPAYIRYNATANASFETVPATPQHEAFLWLLASATDDCSGRQPSGCSTTAANLPLQLLDAGARATVIYPGRNRICSLRAPAVRGIIAGPCRYGYRASG